MKTYARVQNGTVAELFATDGAIADMFYPTLHWINITGQSSIAAGWRYDGSNFAPPPPTAAATPPPTIADLQAQMATLAGQLALLAKTTS